MTSDTAGTRRRSAALFGNEKVVEVVLALHGSSGAATAQELSRITGLSHSMVRDVLLRLTSSGVVLALPKLGGSRSAQYYQPSETDGWRLLVELATWVIVLRGGDAELRPGTERGGDLRL